MWKIREEMGRRKWYNHILKFFYFFGFLEKGLLIKK